MHYFWFSFSKNGKNQGCINVEAETVEQAKDKAMELGIVPKYDHVESYQLSEPELPLDILISPEELRSMEYEKVQYKVRS